MVVMMDMEISCKGHCEKLSHFLDHVSHTVLLNIVQRIQFVTPPTCFKHVGGVMDCALCTIFFFEVLLC